MGLEVRKKARKEENKKGRRKVRKLQGKGGRWKGEVLYTLVLVGRRIPLLGLLRLDSSLGIAVQGLLSGIPLLVCSPRILSSLLLSWIALLDCSPRLFSKSAVLEIFPWIALPELLLGIALPACSTKIAL